MLFILKLNFPIQKNFNQSKCLAICFIWIRVKKHISEVQHERTTCKNKCQWTAPGAEISNQSLKHKLSFKQRTKASYYGENYDFFQTGLTSNRQFTYTQNCEKFQTACYSGLYMTLVAPKNLTDNALHCQIEANQSKKERSRVLHLL